MAAPPPQGRRGRSPATPPAPASASPASSPTAASPTRARSPRRRDLRGDNGLGLAVWPLEHGFEAPGLTVISEQDVLGDRLIRAPRRRKRAENFLTEAAGLTPGDLVVHVDHGIGRYQGLETITAMGAPHECLRARIRRRRQALPAGREHRAPLPLRPRGGPARPARRRRLAGEEGAAEEPHPRHGRAADPHRRRTRAAQGRRSSTPPDHHAWEEFCARFPYAETDDQLAAIDDVLERPGVRQARWTASSAATSASARPRWRCAPPSSPPCRACRSRSIAPTTLLARQHFKSFSERFRGLPLRVRQLSRFVSAKDAAETRAGLADGTHRDRHRHPRAPRQGRDVHATSASSSSTRSSTSASPTRSG